MTPQQPTAIYLHISNRLSKLGSPKRLKALPQLRDDRLVDCNNRLSTLFKSRNSAPTDLPRHPEIDYCMDLATATIRYDGVRYGGVGLQPGCVSCWMHVAAAGLAVQCPPIAVNLAYHHLSNPLSILDQRPIRSWFAWPSANARRTSGARTRRHWAAPSACQSGCSVPKLSGDMPCIGTKRSYIRQLVMILEP
jgi:hypothetical protein